MIRQFIDEYRWLSNFSPVSIELEGIHYPSVEHAYISAKSDNIQWKKKCSSNYTAGQIKRLSKIIQLVDNWEEIKLDIMEECLLQKFSKLPFNKLLIDTGEEHIQEGNTWGDKFWGVDLNTGEGENHLGKLIMKIRKNLILKEDDTI